MKNNMSKLFSVLVMGGAVMAQAQDMPAPEEQNYEEKACQVSVVAKKVTLLDPTKPIEIETCIDEKTDEEVLKIVQEAKEAANPECMSPFCGCWLG